MYKNYTNKLCCRMGGTQQILRVMKLTAVLILACLMQVSAATFAQRVTLKAQHITLKALFKEIRTQTGYDVLYPTGLINTSATKDVDFQAAQLQDVMTQVLQDLPVEFTIDEQSVLIRKKEVSFIDQLKDKLQAAFAQVTVRGQVTDATNQPMAGVTVREKGTENATITDSKGYFTLTVSNADAIVAFSYVGYEIKELTPNYLPKGVVITLVAANTNLHEVVISKGYYNERQELTTGDVTVVGSKELDAQPVSEPIQDLEGKVPGLYITQSSGLPGSSENVLIRGQNSLLNGSNPLYVIDGVPYPTSAITPSYATGALASSNTPNAATGLTPFATISPDEIENIEVLKDADATAIYGSQGANGVILITTKKGKAGKTVVDFDIKQGSAKVAHFMDLMNTQQYLQMRHEAFALDGIPFPSITTNPSDPNFDVNGVWDTTRYTNWQKELIGGTAHYTNATMSISGGNENTQFLVSGAYNRQTTVFPGDFSNQNGSLHFSLTNTSTDKRFTLQFSGGYSYNNSDLPQTDFTGNALILAPDAPALYTVSGALNWQPYGGSATWSNPLANEIPTFDATTKGLTSNLLLSYKILPGLTAKVSTGYVDNHNYQLDLAPASAYAPPNNNNPDYRSTLFAYGENTSWIVEPLLTFDRKVSKGNLSVLLGGSFQENSNFTQGFGAAGFSSDALLANPQNASIFQLESDNSSEYRYLAFLARLGYTWEDKYVLNLTANRDGSSRFGPDKLWGNFGAIGAAWIFSKEKFAQDNLSWLSFGKLHASYGTTGNDQIGDYQYLSSYNSNSATYQGTTGLYPARLPSPYYSWETDEKLEFGLDLGFLKDRINISADYFRNRSGNQLIGYPLPNISGFTTIQANLPAVVQNSGPEFMLNTTNIQSGGFKWSSSFNLSIPHNKLVSFPGIAYSTYSNLWQVGQPTSELYTYAYAGVNPSDGHYEFKSASGGVTENPDNNDRFFTQPITQKFYGGFTNTFSYKGFQLDCMFQFTKQLGYNYWYNGTPSASGIFNYNMPVALINNTWQNVGDKAEFGRLSTEHASVAPYYALSNSSFGISDASFIRLRNAQLSYALPQNWAKAAGMQKASVFIQGENLFTITNYFGLDPETQSSTSLPPLRTIVFGARASF